MFYVKLSGIVVRLAGCVWPLPSNSLPSFLTPHPHPLASPLSEHRSANNLYQELSFQDAVLEVDDGADITGRSLTLSLSPPLTLPLPTGSVRTELTSGAGERNVPRAERAESYRE